MNNQFIHNLRLKNKLILLILILVVGLQFYRPEFNKEIGVTENDFLISEKASIEITKLYKRACYDCHSNQTNYKWYDNVAPISWYVDNTIKKGVTSLNFSNWTKLSNKEKEMMFAAISYDITSSRMPKDNYLRFHPGATLTNIEKQKTITWLKKIKREFLIQRK